MEAANLNEFHVWTADAVSSVTPQMLKNTWHEKGTAGHFAHIATVRGECSNTILFIDISGILCLFVM